MFNELRSTPQYSLPTGRTIGVRLKTKACFAPISFEVKQNSSSNDNIQSVKVAAN